MGRIFDSFNAAYTPCETINGTVNYAKCDPDLYGYSATGIPFNDAYRYVDWFLTVPLLLIEIVLVMKLSEVGVLGSVHGSFHLHRVLPLRRSQGFPGLPA